MTTSEDNSGCIPIYNIHDGQITGGRPLADWYDYLLDTDPDRRIEVPITHLVHFTENKFARDIGLGDSDSFCFKPNNWKPHDKSNRTHNEFKYLSWWSPDPPKTENWGDDIKNHENYKRYYEDYFCTSSIFDGESLYGPIGFVVSWKDILAQYTTSRGENSANAIRLKRFGTFKYKREIMFVILVCIEGDKINYKDQDNNDQEFDVIDKKTKAFRRTDTDEDFIWKVYSTTDGWNPSGGRRNDNPPNNTWDHLSFVFYFPKENDRLLIPPNLCKPIKTKTATKSRTGGKPNRRPYEMRPNEKTVEELNKKINQK